MKFWASAEVHQPASHALNSVRQRVELFLNSAFEKTSLANVNGELRYVPIVMPKEMRSRYTERSQFRRKDHVYVCAPHLDYEVFVIGELEGQLREYIRGIRISVPHLARLGATKEQIIEFETILASATENILTGQPD